MSRISIRSFLATAKQHLQQTHKEKAKACFVIGNESADLDSITCALVYGYLQSSLTNPRNAGNLIIPVTNIPASDLRLRPELTALLKHADIEPSELITLDDIDTDSLSEETTEWTLVDHNVLQGKLGEQYGHQVTALIDHHEDEGTAPKGINPRVVETSGSCNSLIVNYFQKRWNSASTSSPGQWNKCKERYQSTERSIDASTWDAQVAKLSLGAVLIDTVNMTDDTKVTDHDRKAVEYLEAKITAASADKEKYSRSKFYQEIDDAKSNLDDLSLEEILRKDYKQWAEGELNLGMAVSVKPIEYLRDKTDNLEDALKSFSQQRSLQLIALATAYTDSSGDFARQLQLLALADGKAKEAAEHFESTCKLEFQLEEIEGTVEIESQPSTIAFNRSWDQKNLAASRKQVAPSLREAMRSVQGRQQKM